MRHIHIYLGAGLDVRKSVEEGHVPTVESLASIHRLMWSDAGAYPRAVPPEQGRIRCLTSSRSRTQEARSVTRVSHPIDRMEVTFDEANLVANAGLLLVSTLSCGS